MEVCVAADVKFGKKKKHVENSIEIGGSTSYVVVTKSTESTDFLVL